MSLESNKTIVQRVFDEIYNQGNYAAADELIAPQYVSHNGLNLEVLGPEGIKMAARMQHEAFPDLHTTIEDLIAEGDKVVVRGRDRMTHQGTFMGYAPTGKTFEITWIDIFRLEDSKLVEAWLEIDMEQLRKHLSGGV